MRKIIIAMGGFQQGYNRHNEEGNFRDYQLEAERLMASAKPWGFETIIYDNDYILNWPHYNEHKDVLEKSGFGFAFRPIIIYETMKAMANGDVMMYVDSNHTIDYDPSVIINYIAETGIYAQDHIWHFYPQKDFTPRDTFVNMGLDSEKYWESCQLQGNVIGFCKNDLTMQFVEEWMNSSLNYDILFGNNKYPNFPTFIVRRFDQSVFSLLVAKYNFPYVHREANVWIEYTIAEHEYITPEKIIDYSYRMEQDKKDIK